MFLIGKDGINGPDLDQLRKETTANVNGANDSHFKDPEFVKAAKEMHEAKLLAEGGFKGSQFSSLEQRYQGSLATCWASSESGATRCCTKLEGAAPARSMDLFIIMFMSTSRVHPYWTAAAAYQSLCSAVSPLSSSTVDVSPGQLCNGLLHNWLRPGGGECAHVEEIAPGQAIHVREFCPEVVSQASDDPAPPLFELLAFQNGLTDGPVEFDELGINGAQRLCACGPDPVL
jgi:hypothetical protein